MEYETFEKLQELTGYTYPKKVIEGLRSMGIQHKVRGNGTPAVASGHLQKILGCKVETRQTAQEPNFGDM